MLTFCVLYALSGAGLSIVLDAWLIRTEDSGLHWFAWLAFTLLWPVVVGWAVCRLWQLIRQHRGTDRGAIAKPDTTTGDSDGETPFLSRWPIRSSLN